jgi:predicted Zn-dependent protease
MPLEANEELEQIDADVRHVPEVLAMRLQIYGALKKWELMQTVAARLATYDPAEVQWSISFALATRRAESIEAAKVILLAASERHPEEALIHYNLACYECQLGNMAQAKERLSRAITLQKACRLMALEDEDLQPLWESL